MNEDQLKVIKPFKYGIYPRDRSSDGDADMQEN
jgi:hypothetical protein